MAEEVIALRLSIEEPLRLKLSVQEASHITVQQEIVRIVEQADDTCPTDFELLFLTTLIN